MVSSPSAPLLLALDTSTRVASVALYDGQQVLSETSWLAGREHSTRLLVEVDLAMERVGRMRTELTGVVVARGPGSFTGVRVALSVAKGIAAGLGVPAWGIDSLAVLAAAAAGSAWPVRAVIEAGRGRYATALFRDGAAAAPARLATVDELRELIARAHEPSLVIGELSEPARAVLAGEPHARLAARAAGARRAGFLAELGWHAALAGDPGDVGALDAVYVS